LCFCLFNLRSSGFLSCFMLILIFPVSFLFIFLFLNFLFLQTVSHQVIIYNRLYFLV
jgi:hypothetical protein